MLFSSLVKVFIILHCIFTFLGVLFANFSKANHLEGKLLLNPGEKSFVGVHTPIHKKSRGPPSGTRLKMASLTNSACLLSRMNEHEVQYHLAAVQGSLPLIQNFLASGSKINIECKDEV